MLKVNPFEQVNGEHEVTGATVVPETVVVTTGATVVAPWAIVVATGATVVAPGAIVVIAAAIVVPDSHLDPV